MGCDPTSPIAPARVNTLILPCGRLKRTKFMDFVGRVQREDSIRLGDISPDTSASNSQHNMFSPIAFPNGKILFNLTLSPPNSQRLSFSPFELFRAPMLLLCLANGEGLNQSKHNDTHSVDRNAETFCAELKNDLQTAGAQHPYALMIQLLIFDVDPVINGSVDLPDAVLVPPVSQSKSTTMKTIMCDISALFLAKMSAMANRILQMDSIDTPSESLWSATLFSASNMDRGGRPLSDIASSPPLSEPRASKDNAARSNRSMDGTSSTDSPRASGIDVSTATKGDISSATAKRERKSTPGSATLADIAKSRLKLRKGILIGTLFLNSGRWPDALRELVENTRKAKESNDHRWFARGLESILIGLLLLVSVGSQFTIPAICYSSAEKSSKGNHTPSNSNSGPIDIRPSVDSDNDGTLLNLSSAIPEIAGLIVSHYTCPDYYSGQNFPSFIVSDCLIRLGRLLTIIQRSEGKLTRKDLRLVVSSNPQYTIHKSSIRSEFICQLKPEVSRLLSLAIPPTQEFSENAIMDAIMLLSRIGSVLGHAGLRRKQALVYKEVIALLTPAFINSRKRGAAELGIHPAASLSALPNISSTNLPANAEELGVASATESLDSLLKLLWLNYGLQVESALSNAYSARKLPGEAQDSENDLHGSAAALQRAYVDSFGSFGIKSEMIRLSTNFTEAIPNFENLLICISNALITIGPKRISKLSSLDTAPASSKASARPVDNEQTRLASKFLRVIEHMPPEVLKHSEINYWDQFLVRNVELDLASDGRILTPRSLSGGSAIGYSAPASELAMGPFLHSSLLKTVTQRIAEVVVAGEPTIFLVTFQNAFNFEVFVEDATFVTNMGLLSALPQSFSLGPRITRRIPLQVTPTVPGELLIRGCYLQMRGCRAQEFLIFPRPWTPSIDVKIKHFGLDYLDVARRYLSASLARKDENARLTLDDVPPHSAVTTLTVIPAQPTLEITKTSVPESGLVLLTGQSTSFTVLVTNRSSTTPCDFLSITLRRELESSSRGPGEIPNVFSQRTRSSKEPVYMEPGASMEFVFDVVGMPGLAGGTILLDHAYLGSPVVDTDKTFYTQQVKMQLQVTVISTVKLMRHDVIPFQAQAPTSIDSLRTLLSFNTQGITKSRPYLGADRAQDDGLALLRGHGISSQRGIFLLLLDLQNRLTRPLSVSFRLRGRSRSTVEEVTVSKVLLCDRHVVQCGQTIRIVLPVPKMSINLEQLDRTRQGRHPNHASSDEFDYGNGESSFRQALLKNIQGTWEDYSTNTEGTIYLDGIILSPRMMEVMSEQDVSVKLALNDDDRDGDKNSSFPTVACHEVLTLTAWITNRSLHPLKGALKLEPSVVGAGDTVDITRHAAWTGTTWRELDTLEPGHYTRVSTGFAFSTPGRYELQALVILPPERAGGEPSPEGRAQATSRTVEKPELLGHSTIYILVVDA